ncbi:MAG: phospholipase A [Pseudohongiella sp.]|nr:phospholipase A [Pseudohongiella sp.]
MFHHAYLSLPGRHAAALCVVLLFAGNSLSAAENDALTARTPVDFCLQHQVLDPANAQKTVAQLRQLCESSGEAAGEASGPPSVGQSGNSSDTDAAAAVVAVASTSEPPHVPKNEELKGFFRPYKDNYVIFGRMQMDDASVPFSGNDLDTKFELGLTFSLFEGRKNFEFLAPLHIGYSQKSWWNITEESAPFTEHNYNPEIYWQFDQPRRPLMGQLPFVDVIGLEHQSNGQAGLLSRSWDRVYAQKQMQLLPQLSVGIKIWDILGRDTTNDNIRNYLGNGQLSIMFEPNDRTNLRWRIMRGSEVKTFSYTFDIYYRRPNVNGAFFIQYHDGYGEALATYNQKSQSLRGGFYFPLDIFD